MSETKHEAPASSPRSKSRNRKRVKSADQVQQAAVTELMASRLDRTVAALGYALSHARSDPAEQSRRLRSALRDFAPDDARAIRLALKQERLAQRQSAGMPNHDLELNDDTQPGAYPYKNRM